MMMMIIINNNANVTELITHSVPAAGCSSTVEKTTISVIFTGDNHAALHRINPLHVGYCMNCSVGQNETHVFSLSSRQIIIEF